MGRETESEPYNAGDPEHVASAKSRAKTRDERLKNQTRVLMSSGEGRLWVWELLSQCKLYKNPFNGDSAATAFACGEMNVGQRVLAQIMESCPELYLMMQKEQVDG